MVARIYSQRENSSLVKGILILNGIILLILFFSEIPSRECVAYPALLIIDSVILAYLYRNERGVFLTCLFIAYVHYSIAVGVYVFPLMAPDFYNQIVNDAVYDEAIASMILFTCVCMIPCLKRKQFQNANKNICNSITVTHNNKYSTPIEFICLCTYLILFFTQTSWSGDERMSFTALGEYRFLFIILGSLYSKKTKVKTIVWTATLLITSFIGLLGGNRVDLLPAFFILLVVWYPNLSIKKHALWIMPVFVLFQMMGAIRGNLSLLANFEVKELIRQTFEKLFVQETFIFAYFPSLAAIDLGVIQDASIKFSNFIDNIIFIFVGGSSGKYTLSNYTYDFYAHAYGFIGSLYLNYWLGVIGSVIAGAIVAYIIKKTKDFEVGNETGTWKQIVYLCLISTVPRWYVYNFFALFRSILLLTVLYVGFEFIMRVFSSKNRY